MVEPVYTNRNTKYNISCIIVLTIAIIGVFGNAVTLFVFQYAKLKRKYSFHNSWNVVTLFIFNLAFVDFLSSLNMTIIYVQFVFAPATINDKSVCVGLITIRDILVLINASAISCIAIVRVIGVTKNIDWENFCDNSSNVNGVVILTWIVGFLFYIGKLTKVAELSNSEEFDDTFDCGSFFFKLNLSPITLYSEFLAHTLAILIIVVSYAIIAIHVCKSSTSARRSNNTQKDMRTTKLVLVVGGLYIVQCVPYMIARYWFEDTMRVGFFIQFPLALKVCYIIYYTQFSLNIFIYIMRKDDYRSAYVYFMKSVASRCCFPNFESPGASQHPSNEQHELGIVQV